MNNNSSFKIDLVNFFVIVALLSSIKFAPLSANADENAAREKSAASGASLLQVSQSKPALTAPLGDSKGQVLMYGLGMVFQIAPQTAAISCNIRTIGSGHWDFENGTDMVVFDDIATIARQKPITIARNEEDLNPVTGRKRVAVTYPIQVGFVPLGAKNADGQTFAHSGTGFEFSQALCFDLNDQGYYTPAEAKAGGQDPSMKRWYVHQFAYNGQEFRTTSRQQASKEAPVKTADGLWNLIAPGMSVAVPDDSDLLLPMLAEDGKREVTGVVRWRYHESRWQPAVFYGISVGTEPSLIRDVDGSLLYSVRGSDKEGMAVRIWRSIDQARNWTQILHHPTLRSNAPVTLSNAADGTAFIAANQADSFRARLCVWPLNSERTAADPPIVARDCVTSFGSPPKGTLWFADHPIATTVRLSDNQWHGLLGYRVLAFNTDGIGGETPTPQTGCYIEQMNSNGTARPRWKF